MYGLVVVVGSAAQKMDDERLMTAWPTKSRCDTAAVAPALKVARFAPLSDNGDPGFIWSEDRKLVACVDGYLISNNAPKGASLKQHIRAFAETCRNEGFNAGLGSIISGTYNLVVVDLINNKCHVATDHVGAIQLYYSRLESGWIISTNPVFLARTGLIDNEINMTACAELALCGVPIGQGYFLKGIEYFLPDTSFYWDISKSTGWFETNPNSPWKIMPSKKTPTVDQLADRFVESCNRISTIDPNPAHFQSSGKDSRLILAAWPKEHRLTCYTYGDPESLEVDIARSIAELGGSEWKHVWLDGDIVAENLENIFRCSGMIIWPDRYFSARQMHQDGYTGVTDGYWGGVQIHPGGYDSDGCSSRLAKIGRLFTILIDQKVSAYDLDGVTERMARYLFEGHSVSRTISWYASAEFVAEINAQKERIKQNIYIELKRLVPENDSLAILWRNFIASTRGAHNHAQQGVMCRSFLNIYYPHCADLDFHRLILQVRPEVSAHDRQYIKIFRRRFPDYAEIPYGATLLPLKVSPIRAKICRILLSKGIQLPYLTGKTHGRERDANSWGSWLRHSRKLRETTMQLLREGGIINEKNIESTFDDIVNGRKAGTGQVFHLASISKWIQMSRKSSAGSLV